MSNVDLFRKLVSVDSGNVFTTSRTVAELFGKRHGNVLRDIENLDCSDEFKRLNFEFCLNSSLQLGFPHTPY